ncbi:MAG: hypothetical protein GY822_03115 [Deltaproteobacteria bacterium]|nr:hypothetical protein [Deltaproteobacteria bacterium]
MIVSKDYLYVAGGRHAWGTVSLVEVFDLQSRRWQTHAPLLQAWECELITFHDEAFALGGYANKEKDVVRLFEKLGDRHNEVVGKMPIAVSRYAAVIDAEGVVVGDFVNVTQVMRSPLPRKNSVSNMLFVLLHGSKQQHPSLLVEESGPT